MLLWVLGRFTEFFSCHKLFLERKHLLNKFFVITYDCRSLFTHQHLNLLFTLWQRFNKNLLYKCVLLMLNEPRSCLTQVFKYTVQTTCSHPLPVTFFSLDLRPIPLTTTSQRGFIVYLVSKVSPWFVFSMMAASNLCCRANEILLLPLIDLNLKAKRSF